MTTTPGHECRQPSVHPYAEHDGRVAKHYARAREKHPYFCDWMHKKESKSGQIAVGWNLEQSRKWINARVEENRLGWNDILDYKVCKVFDALAKGNKARAVAELYDCVAVLLRTIDVLEGRQAIGKIEMVK